MSAAGLDYTLALLATSAQSSVATRRIRWESMARVLRILQRDFRDSPDAPLSEREVEIARLAWTWANVCMDGPVPPGHDDTGIQRLLHEILEAKTELGSPKLDRLGEACGFVSVDSTSENFRLDPGALKEFGRIKHGMGLMLRRDSNNFRVGLGD